MEFASSFITTSAAKLQHGLWLALNYCKLKVSCCILCTNRCQVQPLLCQYCQADLAYFKHPVVPYNLLSWPAVAQLIKQPHFDQLIAIAPYVWPFKQWISLLKYQHQTELAGLLSHLLVKHWQDYLKHDNPLINSHNSLVLSVPLHIRKWQVRGFNQAHLIAKQFAKASNYRYQHDVIIRAKYTENQVGKSGVARRKNLKNAFELNLTPTPPPHVILIDDVVTTGTTANEICQLLKKHGVQTVTLLCISLALPH
ncbi:comF family protein [Colwellia chukchiensis]|uniref:ComF family protein n=1 Tax=Colwellia chukchiensis TaxID=641665 RepID=A0A1H7Q0D0_9GAMM|nr:ComF family protein [Colwellia chukchiensis]SEL41269.1 comF family protein [Colwellia chukchiensis]